MITVHHLENSRSLRVVWLLEELNLNYKIEKYKRDPKSMLAPKELKDIHPLGKAPIITDENGAHAESGAIIEYILENYSGEKLIPKKEDRSAYNSFKFFMHYAEGSVMPVLVMSLIFSKINSKIPFFIKPVFSLIDQQVRSNYITPTTKTHFNYIDSILDQHKWLTGDHFTAADIQMSFPIITALSREKNIDSFKNIKRFIQQVEERPAYKRAIKQTEPLDFS
ncbi:MAG: glutathione S-transferase [Bdellovibrionales bacterium]|nr:glutathione S-transferase [Bdellovibrionales bacterium]